MQIGDRVIVTNVLFNLINIYHEWCLDCVLFGLYNNLTLVFIYLTINIYHTTTLSDKDDFLNVNTNINLVQNNTKNMKF